ncbi:MAG: LemA family protein [Parcubacteria group bacterium]|nr:LemA family protein [Parcubacteria group bacterium]
MNPFYIVLIILIGGILWIIFAFNRLVTLKNRVKEAWADIDVQLKRRYDLIPNLVETVKGYASHEKELFENVAKMRSRLMEAKGVKEKGEADMALGGALKTLFAVAEDYPELKASQNFAQLQNDLTDTEDKIQAARRFYNGNIRDFNILIESFPSNIIAGIFNFKMAEFFELEEEAAKEPVKVKF